jgi:hypothetical protein
MHCHSLKAGRDIENVPIAKAAETLASFGSGALLIAEAAHLAVPQTEKSLAQPFTADELLRTYDELKSAGVTLRLFPQAHGRKARTWVAINAPGFVEQEKTSDINDARALAYFVAHNNGVALSKPPRSFDIHAYNIYGQMVRERSNRVLRAAKTYGYQGEVAPYIARLAFRLLELSPANHAFVTHKVAFSIASLVVGELGDELVRFTYKMNVPGADSWMKRVLMFSSRHHKGGVARANMARDRFRPFFAEYAQARGECVKKTKHVYTPFGELTPLQDQIRREAWKLARCQVKAAYMAAVKMVRDLPCLELLDTVNNEEVLCGR